MNGYKPSTPRAALGLAAVAMAAITMGALVVLPAQLESVSASPNTLVATEAATKAPITVAISPACIDVRGEVDREAHVHRVARISGPAENGTN
jgi:hypothetical protein